MPKKHCLSLLQTCQGHEDKVWTLAWHPTDHLIITGSSDKRIRVWGKKTDGTNQLECKSILDGGHTRTIRSLAWKPTVPAGQMIFASSSFDATSVVWLKLEDGDFEPV